MLTRLKKLRWPLAALLLPALSALAQTPEAAPAKAAEPDAQILLFWFLLATLGLVLMVFLLLFVLIGHPGMSSLQSMSLHLRAGHAGKF